MILFLSLYKKIIKGCKMKKLTRYFFEGLIVILPAAATIYFIYLIFIKIDGIFSFSVPGLGLIITIGFILLVGFIASNILTRGVIGLMHELFSKLPLVKIIYNAIKDLIEAFVGEKKKFNKPAMVRIAYGSDVEILGFVTEENLELLGEKEKIAVYVPQSYNFAGNLIIVPRRNVRLLDLGAKEVMTFIVSGGLTATAR